MDRLRPGSDAGVIRRLTLFLGVSGLAGLLVAGMLLPVVGSLGLTARASAQSFDSLPSDLETPPLPQQSRILAADGSLLGTFYYENRVSVPLSAVAPVMRQAIVAIEDSRYYDHGGIDLRGTVRAFVSNQQGQSIQGGSTLTQQYVKNVLVESAQAAGDTAGVRAAREKDYARKLRELRYAITLEERLSKDQILERYLNIAYFGSGAYGVEAAARHFFSKPAKALTLTEAATLAGLVQNPARTDPLRYPEAALDRRNVVLSRMAELGYITLAQASKLRALPLGTKPAPPTPNGCATSYAPYFCDYVLRTVLTDKAFGATAGDRLRVLLRGGLTIRTTLDRKDQAAAQKAVDNGVPRRDKSRLGAAIVLVEPGTGALKAMAQNRGWGDNTGAGETKVNYSVDYAYGGSSGFQAGSTFKPFTVAAALKQGMPISTQIPAPSSTSFTGFRNCTTGARFKAYPVSNSTNPGAASVDMRHGIAYSVNTWAVGLEQRTGLCDPVDVAEALGVHNARGNPALLKVPAFTLGVASVSPLSMAEAYATFAARGLHCDSFAITVVTDRDGKKLPTPARTCKQVLDKDVADGVNYLLAGVIDASDIPGRTGARMSLGRPAAGKTGTTSENYDVWFNGYTPDMAAAVWVGDPGRLKGGRITRRPLQDITINGIFYANGYGGLVAGPIWKAAMRSVLKGVPETKFHAPPSSILGRPSFSSNTNTNSGSGVPDVSGLSPRTAGAQLSGAGLSWRIAFRRVSSSAPRGRVAYTVPSAGSSLSPGDRVTIYISRG